MTPTDATTDFAGLFEQDDPWGLASLWYEARKRDLLMAALPEPRYARALEAGCATGLLTERLAARCDALLAVDVVPRAIARTRARVAGVAHVEARVANLPDVWPVGRFDLIVLSELGYYFDRAPWLQTVAHAAEALTPAGTLLACHWLRPFAERRQPTRHVHAAIARQPGLFRHVRHVEPDFLLDVWSRNPAPLRSREPTR
ncbi:class I SAM-dependent DNA methyltransferase [Cupriavidus pauculus]|uniref:Methyltransferase n=1 Tax=Cupriavidus pauculus TaxID=82633 RepID=A0A2N5CF12_9BURK|nr:SAM-dependent methyltransferase [Cupriavidus pauculus]PLQ00806.1 methyltransferase [Cupriavidus pauculus]